MLSEERQSHFANILINGVWNDDLVEYTDDDMAIKLARKAISLFVKEFADIDIKVRGMIQTLKRDIPEGSPEWDVMYSKYFEQEVSRRGG